MQQSTMDRWNFELWRHGEVVFRGSRQKAFWFLVVAVAFTAVCVWFLVEPRSEHRDLYRVVMNYAGIAFFGVLGVPIYCFRLLTARPVVRVGPGGIKVNNEHLGWNEIEQIRLVKLRYGLTLVSFDLTDDVRRSPRGRGSRARRIFARLLRGTDWSMRMLKGAGPQELQPWLAHLHARYTQT